MKTLLIIAIGSIAAFAHADDKAQVGRYQLFYGVIATTSTYFESKQVWKIDTVTGQVWVYVATVREGEAKEGFIPVETREH
jgi:hypothetical protein